MSNTQNQQTLQDTRNIRPVSDSEMAARRLSIGQDGVVQGCFPGVNSSPLGSQFPPTGPFGPIPSIPMLTVGYGLTVEPLSAAQLANEIVKKINEYKAFVKNLTPDDYLKDFVSLMLGNIEKDLRTLQQNILDLNAKQPLTRAQPYQLHPDDALPWTFGNDITCGPDTFQASSTLTQNKNINTL